MAKDKSEKREKKEKKEKHSETDGVSKKSKKEKKDKKSKELPEDVTTTLLNQLEADKPGLVAIDTDGDVVIADAQENGTATVNDEAEKKKVAVVIPKDALVPFANPLADEKTAKKLFKGIKKAAKNKTLKRGVKEVVKSLRKSPTDAPSSSGASNPPGIVVLAADISPMDVISHIPVLCEDHNIPYLYVTSRAELGAAGNTKRPTSVVMVARERSGKKKEDETEEEEDYKEAYADLAKIAEKAGRSVRI